MNSLSTLAAELDQADPLARVRDRFDLPGGVIYLDGNSLGPLPTAVPAAVELAIRQQWGTGLVRSWIDWMRLPVGLGDRVARLIGAREGTVAVGDSASIQLFNALTAAARLRPGRRLLLTDPDHFPTDLYMADSVARLLGLEVRKVRLPELPAALVEYGNEVALTAYPQVDYRTGQLWDLAGLTRLVHQAGALALWDLCHSTGAVEVDVDRNEVDFAVGCSYKYLCGGPGAPGFIYVNARHHDGFDQPLTGWLGHATPFATAGTYEPAAGIARAVIGTPPVLSMVALDAALDIFDELDIAELRRKSSSLTGFFLTCVDDLLTDFDFGLATPRQAAHRGSQVSLRHPDAYPLTRALIEHGVICDMREPDILRFGFNGLFISHTEVYRATCLLRTILENGEHLLPQHVRSSVYG